MFGLIKKKDVLELIHQEMEVSKSIYNQNMIMQKYANNNTDMMYYAKEADKWVEVNETLTQLRKKINKL